MTAPARLDQLKALRAQIDQEIEREIRYQARIRRLRRSVFASTNRAGYTDRVLEQTAAYFDVPLDQLFTHTRDPRATQARQVSMWLLRKANRSYPEIGTVLRRDHTTAMSGVKKVDATPHLLAAASEIQHALVGDDTEDVA